MAGIHRILCFGDSVTVGFHSNGNGYDPYGRTLADALGMACEVCSLGLCGLTAQEMLESQASPIVKDRVGNIAKGYVVALQDDGPFDLCILMAGTNDIGMDEPAPHIASWVQQLHNICTERGIPTIAILPPTITRGKPRQTLNMLKGLVRGWAQSAQPPPLACVDIEDLVPRTTLGLWEPEEFHLSAAGSQHLGRQLAHMVKPMLARMRAPCAGRGSHRRLEPTSASLDAAGHGTYSVGETVEVWSNSTRCWCQGKVISVSGARVNQQVNVQLDIGSGRPAVKVLPANNEGLRKARRPPPGPGPTTVAPKAGGYAPSVARVPYAPSAGVPYANAAPPSPATLPVAAIHAPSAAAALPAAAAPVAMPASQQQPVTHVPPLAAMQGAARQPSSPSRSPARARPASPRPAGGGSPTRPSSAGPLQEGSSVEVWSKQFKAWCPGKVKQIKEKRAVVSMMLPQGVGAVKDLPLDSSELRAASANGAADAPLIHLSSAKNLDYKNGDEVQVWSKGYCSWCDGKVIGFQDSETGGSQLVQAEFELPDGQVARKALAPQNGGLRRRKMPTQEIRPGRSQEGSEAREPTSPTRIHVNDSLSLDYRGELGLQNLADWAEVPYAVGDAVEVWSKSKQAWCPGKVVSVENGVVHANMTLPDGAIAKKLLLLEDPHIRAMRSR